MVYEARALSSATHQVCEIVAAFSSHETVREAKTNHVLHVGVEAGRIGFQQHVHQARQEVISVRRLIVGGGERFKDVLTAFGHTGKLVLWSSLGVHFYNG